MEHVSWWNSNQSNSILTLPPCFTMLCMLEWAAASKEKPCHLACQSFRNFLDLCLKSTNHHKHSWSRWLPWRLLNLRPMCLDWQMQVNVRLLADTHVKIMKLNQEEMCRLHSRVKTKTMYDIVICKSFLSCIRVIKLWSLMPSSYFEAFNAVLNLWSQFDWTRTVSHMRFEMYRDVPLKSWHLDTWGHQPVDVLDHQCFLYEQRDLSSRTATRKQAHVELRQEDEKHFAFSEND